MNPLQEVVSVYKIPAMFVTDFSNNSLGVQSLAILVQNGLKLIAGQGVNGVQALATV